jgi:hypothetical protein
LDNRIKVSNKTLLLAREAAFQLRAAWQMYNIDLIMGHCRVLSKIGLRCLVLRLTQRKAEKRGEWGSAGEQSLLIVQDDQLSCFDRHRHCRTQRIVAIKLA